MITHLVIAVVTFLVMAGMAWTISGWRFLAEHKDTAFDFAWFLHQKRGRHHWQWWVLPEDSGAIKVLPILDCYRKEMLADWRGAGRAQGTPNTSAWYNKNKEKLQLHPETRKWIEICLLNSSEQIE